MSRRLRAVFCAFLLILLFVPRPTPAAGRIATFAELDQAVAAAEAALGKSPSDSALADELARLQILAGRQVEAERLLQATLVREPQRVSSLLQLAALYRRQYKFAESRAALEKIPATAAARPDVRLLGAALLLDAMDYDQAAALLRDMLQKDPACAAAWCGLAEAAYWENRYEEAEEAVRKSLAADPACARAHLLQSLIHRIRQENEQWAAAGRRAVAADPFDDEARANLANILMRGEKKLEEGYAEAKTALRLNPFCWTAHNYIGNGWTAAVYADEVIPGTPEAQQKVRGLLQTGDEALQARALDKAEAAFRDVLAHDNRNLSALVGLGTADYHRGRFAAARDRFQQALAVNPDYGLAHYGMAQSMLRLRDAFNVRLAAAARRFAAQDAPEPSLLRDVFVNYTGLDPELQKIVRLAVRPLRGFLPLAKAAGATFFLTPFHWRQSQAPHMAGIRGQRTFDLRLWDDVKGLGGLHALSGEEWERDVRFLRFNVVAHEFAHQIHGLLDQGLRDEIQSLYAKAKTERRTLDFYSDANVMEYFAVGVEAYVSDEKLPDQKITYGHTRRELQERDPALFALISRLDKLESPPTPPTK